MLKVFCLERIGNPKAIKWRVGNEYKFRPHHMLLLLFIWRPFFLIGKKTYIKEIC